MFVRQKLSDCAVSASVTFSVYKLLSLSAAPSLQAVYLQVEVPR